MSAGLQTTVSADARPLEKDLAKIEKMTMASIGRMQNGVNLAPGPSLSTALEQSRGKLGRRFMGIAHAEMLTSVARDSAASLASGANPLTVAMQQTPQLLQWGTMAGKSAVTTFMAKLFSAIPIGALVATAWATFKGTAILNAANLQTEATGAAASIGITNAKRAAIARLGKMRDKMDPGEADSYIAELIRAKEWNVSRIIGRVIARMIQLQGPNEIEQSAIDEMRDLNTKMFVAGMTKPFEAARTAARLAFDERNRKIEETYKKSGTSLEALKESTRAYELNRNQLDAELKRITASELQSKNQSGGGALSRSLTERQHIGAMIGSSGSGVQIVDLTRQHLQTSQKILAVMERRGESVVF